MPNSEKTILTVNPVYRKYLTDVTPTQIFFGGSSSGKSFFLAQRAVLDLLKGRNYLAVRNTANTLRSSIYNELKKSISALNLDRVFSINKSEMTITCKQNGSQAILKGLDDVEKIKSITPEKGVITDIWIEEATETDEGSVKQLEKRLRGISDNTKRVILSFNPIIKTHWIYKKYFTGFYDNDKELRTPQLTILKTVYQHNRFLTSDDIYRLENETDEYWYNVYTLGNWGTLGNVIFTNWTAEDLTEQKKYFDNIRNGLDFGYGPDPFAFTKSHYDSKRGIIYIIDERAGHELTNQEIASIIKPLTERQRVTCDSAEPKSIRELQLAGIIAHPAVKGPDSVNFGIQWLKQKNVIIDRKCQGAINEFQLYQWKKTRAGETLPIPSDRDNHHIDSLRYALEDCMEGVQKVGFKSVSKRTLTGKSRGY